MVNPHVDGRRDDGLGRHRGSLLAGSGDHGTGREEHGDLVTSVMTKAKRPGKVFLDWSQNSGSKTTVSPYSLRGKERPTAATPLTWAEVEAGAEDDLALDQFTMDEVLERIAELGDVFEA